MSEEHRRMLLEIADAWTKLAQDAERDSRHLGGTK